jgi:hypothetical protein
VVCVCCKGHIFETDAPRVQLAPMFYLCRDCWEQVGREAGWTLLPELQPLGDIPITPGRLTFEEATPEGIKAAMDSVRPAHLDEEAQALPFPVVEVEGLTKAFFLTPALRDELIMREAEAKAALAEDGCQRSGLEQAETK